MGNEKKSGMTPQELRDAIPDIQLKQWSGQKLSKRDEYILYWFKHMPRCHHKH